MNECLRYGAGWGDACADSALAGHPSPDPTAHYASMKTADALSVPVEARYQQVGATRIAQAEQVQREQQQAQTRAQDQSNQSGPKMTA